VAEGSIDQDVAMISIRAGAKNSAYSLDKWIGNVGEIGGMDGSDLDVVILERNLVSEIKGDNRLIIDLSQFT